MNKSIFMGHLVRDPEIRFAETEKGELMIANFRIAVNRKFVKKDGVKTDYFSCSAFGRQAEFAEKYLMQGVKVIVTGRIENENYKNREGEQVYSVRLMAEDIEFAESKKAMEDRMEKEDYDRDNRSAERDSQRNSSDRSGRSASASRERDQERGRRGSGSAKRSEREYDGYEEDRESERSSGRRNSSSRSYGGRSSGSSAASRGGQSRNRSVDDEYMNMEDADAKLDFD